MVAAKKLLDEGLSPTVFERNAEPGGNWLYGAPGSSVYRSTHLISSKRLPEFRDFPLPAALYVDTSRRSTGCRASS